MLLDDIADYLVTNTTLTVGGSTGTLAKTGLTDLQPDTVMVMIEQSGTAPSHTFSTGTATSRVWEYPALQLLSRSTSYQTARNAAETAYTALDGVTATINTRRYGAITALQTPFSVGRDQENRYLVSVNFLVTKETG